MKIILLFIIRIITELYLEEQREHERQQEKVSRVVLVDVITNQHFKTYLIRVCVCVCVCIWMPSG